MASDVKAKFAIGVDSDSAEQSLDSFQGSVEELADAVTKGQAKIKGYNESLRNLRGSSEEVVALRKKLKANMDAERNAITGAEVRLLKQGQSSKMVAESRRKQAEAAKKADETSKAMALETTAALGGAAAAAVAVAAGVAAATAAFGYFVFGAAGAARSASLLREAATGSATNASALGSQIDALSGKLPTARAELEALGVSMAKGGLQGAVLVDALKATATTSAALGDDAGSKIRGILEAGRTSKRIAIDPREGLIGTGLNFDDVAKELATGMKVGVAEARQALAEGRVSLSAGAEAIRGAVDKKFGALNARKALDFNVQLDKAKESLGKLASGVNIEPLLKGLSGVFELLSDKTVTGLGIKKLVELLGNGMVSALTGTAPIAKAVVQGLVIGFLTIAIAAKKAQNRIKEALGGSDVLGGVDGMKVALKGAELAVYGLAIGLGALAASAAAAALPFALGAAAIYGVYKAAVAVKDLFSSSTDWEFLGKAITDGFVNGVKSGAQAVKDSVTGLAGSAKRALKSALGIASPSRVGREIGANLGSSVALGASEQSARVETAASGVGAAAAQGMASGASGTGSRSAQAQGGKFELHLTINADGGGAAIERHMQNASFVPQILKGLEDLVFASGAVPRGAT